jgi:tRNA (guanine-N7-)-methyltransferase
VPEDLLLRVRERGAHLDRPWSLTYLRNRGKVTRAQKEAWRTLWPHYGIDVQTHAGGGGPPPRLDFREVFADRPEAPLALEIGFGLGHSLMEMAVAHPDKNFVGVEVHKPGIGAALQKIQARRDELGDGWVDNVRVVRMDALWLVRDFVPLESLSDV